MTDEYRKLSDIVGGVRADILEMSELSNELERLIAELDHNYSSKLVDRFELLQGKLAERLDFMRKKSHLLTTIVETNSLEIVDTVISVNGKPMQPVPE